MQPNTKRGTAKPSLFFVWFGGRSGVLQLAAAGGLQVREDEAVQIAVHHGVDVAGLVAGAVVLDHGVGHKDIAADLVAPGDLVLDALEDRKSTRLNSSHVAISYAVFCF